MLNLSKYQIWSNWECWKFYIGTNARLRKHMVLEHKKIYECTVFCEVLSFLLVTHGNVTTILSRRERRHVLARVVRIQKYWIYMTLYGNIFLSFRTRYGQRCKSMRWSKWRVHSLGRLVWVKEETCVSWEVVIVMGTGEESAGILCLLSCPGVSGRRRALREKFCTEGAILSWTGYASLESFYNK